MRERDITLDVLKGIGMLLVVFAHTNMSGISSVIYTFHMPLFFFLSGGALIYSSKKHSLDLKGYASSLVIPYLVFSIVSFVYWFLIESRFRPSDLIPIYSGSMGLHDVRLQEFYNIFTAYSAEDAFIYNIVLWFLPCLLCSMVIYRGLKLYSGAWLPLCVIGLSALYFINEKTMPLLPWCMEIALVALPFVYAGDKCYVLFKKSNHWGLLAFALLIVISVLLFSNPHIDMRAHGFSEWWIFYPIALSFIYLIIQLSRIISCYEYGVLQWIGRNSLIIMCIHEPLKRIVLKLSSVILGIEITVIRESFVASLLMTIIILLVLFPITHVVSRCLSFFLSKKTQ